MPPVCVIVGAGEGLGAALASRFCGEGCDLALISRTAAGSARAMEVASSARTGAIVRAYQADVTQPETLETVLTKVAEDIGPVDILIYNVRGSFTRCAPLDMTYDALTDIFQVEVIGAFAAAKAVLPGMRARGRGTILFSSATAAFRGAANYPLYAIGKFGLRALSQNLAKAYAADGVHVAHMRLDCDLDTPVMQDLYGDAYDPETLAKPEDVAQSYWLTHLQPRSAWSNEVELRPHTETWTY